MSPTAGPGPGGGFGRSDDESLDEAAADLAASQADALDEVIIEFDAEAVDVEADLDALAADAAALADATSLADASTNPMDPMAQVARERDDYLDSLRHLQADFENYKKRMARQQAENVERANERLVSKLLPVFDTADLAMAHAGGEEVKQIWTALFDVVEKEGLLRVDSAEVVFDPTLHDAVAHEPGTDGGEPVVAEVLRAGYLWKGRVLRPAMVKVRG